MDRRPVAILSPPSLWDWSCNTPRPPPFIVIPSSMLGILPLGLITDIVKVLGGVFAECRLCQPCKFAARNKWTGAGTYKVGSLCACSLYTSRADPQTKRTAEISAAPLPIYAPGSAQYAASSRGKRSSRRAWKQCPADVFGPPTSAHRRDFIHQCCRNSFATLLRRAWPWVVISRAASTYIVILLGTWLQLASAAKLRVGECWIWRCDGLPMTHLGYLLVDGKPDYHPGAHSVPLSVFLPERCSCLNLRPVDHIYTS